MSAQRFVCLLNYALFILFFTCSASADTLFPDTPDDVKDFIRQSRLDLKGRVYYMNRHFDGEGTQESLAVGGWADYESAYWHGIGAGFAVYTSQGLLFTDKDKSGTGLLNDNQGGYTVLGQAYIQALVSKTRIRGYRQALDTPLLNRYDCKMTPVTFEALTIESRDIPSVLLTLSHVTGIKGWTDTTYQSPTVAAGFPDEDQPITLGGVVYEPDSQCKIQLWDYFCPNYLNSVYFQADVELPLDDKMLSMSFQRLYQRDVGRGIGGEFSTGMSGIQTVFGASGFELTLGFTLTDEDHDIVNPWASYPGYTSIMEEDDDRAGEKAVVFGLSYDFSGIGLTGLNARTFHTQSWTPDRGETASPDQNETDFTLEYDFPGKLRGLQIALRNAWVFQDEALGGRDYSDFRVIVNYDLSMLSSKNVK